MAANYLQSITADPDNLLQALQATASATPCVVILTPESRIPCGATTFTNYVVRKLFQCYNSPAHPDQNFITKLQAYQASQCVVMAPLECRRDGFVDDVVKEASQSLFCNRPIWIYSYQQPEAPAVKVPVFVIRLKPVPRIDSSFPVETFTEQFYQELKSLIPELASCGKTVEKFKYHLSGVPERQALLEDFDCYDWGSANPWNSSAMTRQGVSEYFEAIYNKARGITASLPEHHGQSYSERELALIRAGIIHDSVTALLKLSQLGAEPSQGVETFNFTFNYTTVDQAGTKTTTNISHDFNAALDSYGAKVKINLS